MENKWQRISGWGRFPFAHARVLRPANEAELLQALKANPGILARGNGRSYGDSSLHTTVLDTRSINAIISESDEWIEVGAGITIESLLSHIVPKRKFLSVTPGIRSITIGGAIASDVHGKNHLACGSFFNTVSSLRLATHDGTVLTCSRQQNAELFFQCFGGMGLTGIVLSAVVRLVPLPSTWMREEQDFAGSVTALMALMEAKKDSPYLVAWLDLLNVDIQCVVKTGRWLSEGEVPGGRPAFADNPDTGFSLPFVFPMAPPKMAFKWYNKRYLAKARRQPAHTLHYTQFFYPLDSIGNWNYVFGPKGFLQYHFVLPLATATQGMEEIVARVKASKAVCTLAVMKLFGKGNPETPHSFPREGYNLAMDFINNPAAVSLIGGLDKMVGRLGGSVYKTKDALSTLPAPIMGTGWQSQQNVRYGKNG